jgi:restriction system protein
MKRNNQNDKSIWVIRAGRSGETSKAAHDIFVRKHQLVLDAQRMDDLRKLPEDRDSFYAAYRHAHPDAGIPAISGIGGKFFRFIHEIKVGDIVLYPWRIGPWRIEKIVYIGFVAGPYRYSTKEYPDLPHIRKVRWIGSFTKKTLSLGAFRELGGARSLYLFKSHTSEIIDLMSKLDPVANPSTTKGAI